MSVDFWSDIEKELQTKREDIYSQLGAEHKKLDNPFRHGEIHIKKINSLNNCLLRLQAKQEQLKECRSVRDAEIRDELTILDDRISVWQTVLTEADNLNKIEGYTQVRTDGCKTIILVLEQVKKDLKKKLEGKNENSNMGN